MPKTTDPGLFEDEVTLRRFLLVISPTPAMELEVTLLKQKLREHIGGFSGSGSVPHLTLFYADLPAECERDVCDGIMRGCQGQRRFQLHLNGITYFPDKRTIYIDPVEKEVIGAIRKSTVAHVRMFKNIRKLGVNATDHPHLTIAAGLKPHQFEQAWAMLAPHAYTSEQHVGDVVLLRRELVPGGRYERVKRFALQ